MIEDVMGQESAIAETRLQVGDSRGDYVRLEDLNDGGVDHNREADATNPRSRRSWWFWGKLIAWCVFFGVLILVVIKWAGPYFLKMEVVPFIRWERKTFSTSALTAVIVATVAFFPALFLPTTPSMWVAGMTFGYVVGFLIILSGMAVGVSVPYCIGTLFNNKIQRWLDKHPKKASVIRLAGEGNWFHQFKAVALIRLSPFPFVLFNYAAVATNVKYSPYFLGSLVGLVPEIFVSIYSGILIQSLVDATEHQKSTSTLQNVVDVSGFCASVAATVMMGFYANKQIRKLQENEEPLPE